MYVFSCLAMECMLCLIVVCTYVGVSLPSSSPTLVLSQPSSCVNVISDANTSISSSPVTTFSIAECSTTSSNVVTSDSGQNISMITTTAGKYTNAAY